MNTTALYTYKDATRLKEYEALLILSINPTHNRLQDELFIHLQLYRTFPINKVAAIVQPERNIILETQGGQTSPPLAPISPYGSH